MTIRNEYNNIFKGTRPISNTLAGGANMQKKPEIIVFAGPNGSGKTAVQDF